MRVLPTILVLSQTPAVLPFLAQAPFAAPVASAAAVRVEADVRWLAADRGGQVLRVTLGTRGG